MIEIYLIDPKQISSVDMSTLYHSLTDEEQAKIKPLHENRRDEFIIGHGLLKSLLASKYNITSPLKYNEHGKPFVEGAHFNITHTKGLVLLAFGDCEIGIDVENLARQKDWQKIVDRYFHPMEQKFITDQDLFYQLWTKKRAFLSATEEELLLS
jgi:4'-phosphopantetheinyl transferase